MEFSLLHACGDVSHSVVIGDVLVKFAPRMWRCFLSAFLTIRTLSVCSTHVEMFPPYAVPKRTGKGLLHACGDVSNSASTGGSVIEFAPRMWRCFSSLESTNLRTKVCSTHVEMFLDLSTRLGLAACLLHACGDVSDKSSGTSRTARFAPRMWRCFQRCRHSDQAGQVCSTHVEMFPHMVQKYLGKTSLLHACGDVSRFADRRSVSVEFAPRMWRCFPAPAEDPAARVVCSTHVEMFLESLEFCQEGLCLLHACGDVSMHERSNSSPGRYAPRMWRCFLLISATYQLRKVCSTHVEMFLSTRSIFYINDSLLHACGDVSKTAEASGWDESFAPRMWRCFLPFVSALRSCQVCSTHVEMFLTSRFSQDVKSSLLHACGDVSVPRFVPLLTLLVCSTHVEMFPSRQVPPAPR